MSDQRGSATVLLVIMLSLALVACGAVLAVARVGVGRAQASTAADLAALAAAAAGDCAVASGVAAANGAVLDSCEQQGQDFLVTTVVQVSVLPPHPVSVTASARAGPPD